MNLKKLALAALIVMVIGAAGLYYYIQSVVSAGGGPPPETTFSPQYNFSILESGAVDYGTDGTRSLYILYSIESHHVPRMRIEARRFPSQIPTDIYLLDYPCDGCLGKAPFAGSLEQSLKAKGVIPQNGSLSVVKINELARVTKPGIIVVPTGRLPQDLVDQQSDANMGRLTGMGSVIVYIGGDLTLSMGRDGAVREMPEGALEPYNITSVSTLGGGTDSPYRLEQSRFTLVGPGASQIAGAIYAQPMGSGYFVAFPDTLDLGWSRTGPAAAGEDVAELIYQAAWETPITTGTDNLTLAMPHNNLTKGTLFMAQSDDNGGYVRLYLTAFAPNQSQEGGNETFRREYVDLSISNPVTGRMSHPPVGVNGSTLDFHMRFQESFPEPREIGIFLRAYKDGDQVQEQDLGTVSFVTVYERDMHFNVNLSGGDHILRVQDFSAKTYAQSFLHIPDVAIVSTADPLWEQPLFTFRLISDGSPVANTAVQVSIDGAGNASLITDSEGNFAFVPAEVPSFGMHMLSFAATGKLMSLQFTRVKPTTFFDDPKNQVLVVAILIVAVLGVALQRTEPPKYFIDVPDFPPQKKERIPLSRFSLINLIESTNKDYRWKFMPLTSQEIKANVRKKLTYLGKPIMISDYNLEKLLGQLTETGELFQASGLFGLKGWVAQSGKSPRYLAMFRTLRNFFINNAVLFTDVGQRTDCDTLANYRGENLFIHIYDGGETVVRVLLAARKGRNYLVFESQGEMEEFMRRLSTSATPPSVALKMEMDSRQVALTHLEALGRILGRAS